MALPIQHLFPLNLLLSIAKDEKFCLRASYGAEALAVGAGRRADGPAVGFGLLALPLLWSRLFSESADPIPTTLRLFRSNLPSTSSYSGYIFKFCL